MIVLSMSYHELKGQNKTHQPNPVTHRPAAGEPAAATAMYVSRSEQGWRKRRGKEERNYLAGAHADATGNRRRQ